MPHNGRRTLHLQIESARMFPGLKPRTVSVPATDVRLSQPLFQERSGGVSLKVLEARRLQQERASKLGEGNIVSLPFRQLRFLLGKGFQAIKAIFTNNPFIYLRAQGYNGSWKLDKESGWALEDGRAIDRIVKYKLTA